MISTEREGRVSRGPASHLLNYQWCYQRRAPQSLLEERGVPPFPHAQVRGVALPYLLGAETKASAPLGPTCGRRQLRWGSHSGSQHLEAGFRLQWEAPPLSLLLKAQGDHTTPACTPC